MITDIAMPERDGYDLLREVRARAALPVLVLSAQGREDERTRAINEGFSGYLTKPVTAEELARTVASIVRPPA